jgi:cellobiose-specific phosphotransferase system component IIA
MKKLSYLVVFAGLAISSTAFAVDWSKHPHLQKAKEQINDAKKSLKDANDHEKSEFGGHRAAAEKLLDQAKGEIDAAADWAETHK